MHVLHLLGLVAVSAALVAPSAPVLHERRDAAPRKWIKREAVEASRVLPMRIALRQPNLDEGHDLLMKISSPDSPHYAQWMSQDQIHEFFAPPQAALEAVKAWLQSAGVAADRISQSANKQWIQFNAPVAEAEALLNTKYWNYEHSHSGVMQIACDEYHVPGHVQEHIDYVQPGLRLMAGGRAHAAGRKERATNDIEARGFRTSSSSVFSGPIFGKKLSQQGLPNLNGSTSLALCDKIVTPPCIKAMYNISQPNKANPNNKLGIFEEGDFYAAEDLAEFFTLFARNIPPTTEPILEGIDGGFAPSAYAGGESDLDFQISYPIIYPQQEILFQTDDLLYATGVEPSSGFLNTFFDAIDGSYCTFSAYGETGDASIDPKYPDPNPAGYSGQRQCGVYKPTNVISISYGEQEDDLPTNYQQRQCAEVMKLGMQGVTVVLASGDSGVAARSTDDGNADGCLGPAGTVFNPDFPASCPYLTSVGATYLPPGGSAAKDQEVAVTRFPSGGGFSNIYPQPSYQAKAVNTYLSAHNPGYKSYNTSGTNNPSNTITENGALIYNRAGRGYPDLSAIGDNVLIINNGAPTLIGGTSAAAPVFASILNRINEERIAKGKRSVGFVNPTLYANPWAFHDITVGNNSGCGTPGFYAAKGWDPVTGLGTPNYPSLLKVFMDLP